MSQALPIRNRSAGGGKLDKIAVANNFFSEMRRPVVENFEKPC